MSKQRGSKRRKQKSKKTRIVNKSQISKNSMELSNKSL